MATREAARPEEVLDARCLQVSLQASGLVRCAIWRNPLFTSYLLCKMYPRVRYNTCPTGGSKRGASDTATFPATSASCPCCHLKDIVQKAALTSGLEAARCCLCCHPCWPPVPRQQSLLFVCSQVKASQPCPSMLMISTNLI